MNKKTKVILTLIIILVGTFIAVSTFTSKSFESELTQETYSEYDQYGLDYQETKTFEYLSDLLDISTFELIGGSDDTIEFYISNNVEVLKAVSDLINSDNTITELLLTKNKDEDQIMNYMIDYETKTGKRVILTYTYTGYVSKIISSRFTIVEVNNELRKQTRYKLSD